MVEGDCLVAPFEGFIFKGIAHELILMFESVLEHSGESLGEYFFIEVVQSSGG